MKKLILKSKLHSRDEFELALDRAGYDLGPIYWQHDRIYLPRGFKRGESFPRLILRTEMKAVDRPPKYSLILKRHIEASDLNVENATVIKDYVEAANLVLQLGFELSAEVSRKRQEAHLPDGTLIFLDKVETLPSYYAKIETVVPDGSNLAPVRHDLKEIFSLLGLTSSVEETYAESLLKKPN